MSVRKVRRRPLQKIAVGDMRARIELYQRELTPPTADNFQATETYTLLFERWAKIESLSGVGAGRIIFDDIDIGNQPNVIFSIRYNSSVTSETRIKYRGEYYKIIKVIDPEERHKYLFLYSKILGDEDKEANE